MKYLLSILTLSILFFSCNKIDNSQDLTDDKIITDYLSAKKLSATKTSSGLYYHIDTVGTGKKINSTNTIFVKYTGKLSNDSIFDQNLVGTSLNLKTAINGWKEGLTYFNVGSIGKLYIPSKLGYGKNNVGKVPSNSVLIFDIEVIEIQ
jgi:FKBP-type peptidyl-prolyl cis-trans isomerase FkpA